jgi:hypothetical protein
MRRLRRRQTHMARKPINSFWSEPHRRLRLGLVLLRKLLRLSNYHQMNMGIQLPALRRPAQRLRSREVPSRRGSQRHTARHTDAFHGDCGAYRWLLESVGRSRLRQPPHPGPFHRSTGIAAIIILSIDGPPPLLALAQDVGMAGFTLGVERIEGLFQTFF